MSESLASLQVAGQGPGAVTLNCSSEPVGRARERAVERSTGGAIQAQNSGKNSGEPAECSTPEFVSRRTNHTIINWFVFVVILASTYIYRNIPQYSYSGTYLVVLVIFILA